MKKYLIIISLLCIYFNLQAGNGVDIVLEKGLDTAGPYNPGDNITYTIIVINMGPGTATNVTITDTPVNMTITSVSSTSCSALPCIIPTFPYGPAEFITVTATIDANGPFDNSATAIADQADPNPANNTDDTGNGGNTVNGAVRQVPGLNLISLGVLILLMTVFLFRRKSL